MKMAKASYEEWQALADWFEAREAAGEPVPQWRRVVHGFRVVVDNACDPDQDTLEWKPGVIHGDLTLVVTRRAADYHCCAQGDAARWACGPTPDSAVGNWIRTHKPFPVDLSALGSETGATQPASAAPAT